MQFPISLTTKPVVNVQVINGKIVLPNNKVLNDAWMDALTEEIAKLPSELREQIGNAKQPNEEIFKVETKWILKRTN